MGNHSKHLLLMLDVELELVAEPLCLCILNISIFPYKKKCQEDEHKPTKFYFQTYIESHNRVICKVFVKLQMSYLKGHEFKSLCIN